MRVFIFALLTCGTFLFGNCAEEAGHPHGEGLDPFEEVQHLFNISAGGFGADSLQLVIEHYSERFECVEEGTVVGPACPLAFCLNASQLIVSLGLGPAAIIDEETFENISALLVAIAANLNETCHRHLDPTPETIRYYQGKLIQQLGAYGTPGALSVGSLQEFLEVLPLGGDDHEDDHDDEDDDDHDDDVMHDDTEDNHMDEDDHMMDDDHGDEGAEDGHEDEHLEIFEHDCVGADVLFGQLQKDVNDVVTGDDLGHLFSLLVYHLLEGSHVSRECRLLPQQEYFTTSIFREHGGQNGTLPRAEFAEMLEELGIGGAQHSGSDVMEDDGHGHRRKRSIPTADFLFKQSWEGKCYSAGQLLAVYDVDGDVTMTQFSALCPALVQQQLNKACVMPAVPDEHGDEEEPSLSERYGYGTVATFIICLASVIGAVFVRCGSRVSQDRMMHLFIGLAVGTLLADALIHLIPQAMGLHGHEEGEDDHGHDGEGIVVEPFVWYAIVTCGGLYVFYILELLMASCNCMTHSHDLGDEEPTMNGQQGVSVKVTKTSAKYLPSQDDVELSIESESSSKKSVFGLAPVAYMVLIGDSIHNFLDGMAIGASFSISVKLGVSTSIAVLCHEVPHELGDFAILLKSGLSFCRALAFNFLSALTAMAGFYVGVAISTNEDTERWIIAVTAGMFLYISLVSMLPDMLKQARVSKVHVLLNNVGFLVGMGIMVLLAVFEEKIKI